MHHALRIPELVEMVVQYAGTRIADNELPTLPARQRALIEGILSDLPGNAPRLLQTCLSKHNEELLARGLQPILGLLNDMASICKAATSDTYENAGWLTAGMRVAFEKFDQNHSLFVTYFPLDLEREQIYSSTDVDESNASGDNIAGPFEEIYRSTKQANKAGLRAHPERS